MKATDVVYVFRRSDTESDVELLYSLRSVKKNFIGLKDIWILGDTPRFFEDVCVPYTVIPLPDPYPASQKNVRSKLDWAAHCGDLSSEFLIMNDDFYFLTKFNWWTVPRFRQGMLQQHIEWREEQATSPYVRALQATLDQLKALNLPTVDFECHTPFPVSKGLLLEVVSNMKFDWSVTYGLVWRSLYGNNVGYEGVRHMDLKIDSPMGEKELDRCFASCPFLSTGKGGLNDAMLEHFRAAFPP